MTGGSWLDHWYCREMREWGRRPTATSAAEFARHKRLLAEALGRPQTVEIDTPDGPMVLVDGTLTVERTNG